MHIHKQIALTASPAKLWPYLTEPELLKSWITDIVDDVPEDPAKTTGVGVRSTMRIREGGKVSTYQSVVIAWEHERTVAVRLTGGSFGEGMAMDVRYDITPTATGSLLDYDVEIPLKGFFIVMAPMIWLFSQFNAGKALNKLREVTT